MVARFVLSTRCRPMLARCICVTRVGSLERQDAMRREFPVQNRNPDLRHAVRPAQRCICSVTRTQSNREPGQKDGCLSLQLFSPMRAHWRRDCVGRLPRDLSAPRHSRTAITLRERAMASCSTRTFLTLCRASLYLAAPCAASLLVFPLDCARKKPTEGGAAAMDARRPMAVSGSQRPKRQDLGHNDGRDGEGQGRNYHD